MTNENTIAIHSARIAGLIIDAGQPVLRIEANRNKRGKLVFVFQSSAIVTKVLGEARRG